MQVRFFFQICIENWHNKIYAFSRMGSQFESIQVRNSNFAAFIDSFTPNTYIMVILPEGNVSATATSMNIRNARKHFEKLDSR